MPGKKPKGIGISNVEEEKNMSPLMILMTKLAMVCIYIGALAGLAFVLAAYYMFIWQPVTGNYSDKQTSYYSSPYPRLHVV